MGKTENWARATFATLLLKNNYSPKAVSKIMGHAKELITVDVYGDKQKIIEDCLEELEPFIQEVLPKEEQNDFSADYEYIYIIEEYSKEVERYIKEEFKIKVNDFSKDYDYFSIIEEYVSELNLFTRILTR